MLIGESRTQLKRIDGMQLAGTLNFVVIIATRWASQSSKSGRSRSLFQTLAQLTMVHAGLNQVEHL